MVGTQLTKAPSVDVGLLIRRPPHDVFEALADPSITTEILVHQEQREDWRAWPNREAIYNLPAQL